MTSPPRVISVYIWVKTRPDWLAFMKLTCSGSYKFYGHIFAPWTNTPHIPQSSLFSWAWLLSKAACLVISVNFVAIPLFTYTTLTLSLLPLALFCWELAPTSHKAPSSPQLSFPLWHPLWCYRPCIDNRASTHHRKIDFAVVKDSGGGDTTSVIV